MKMYSLLRHISSLLLFLFFVSVGNSQNPVVNGYMFHGAIRDKAGDLWFATTGAGVYRYNHSTETFTNFTERDGLCANNVSSVYEDRTGSIWISTDHGICQYNTSINTFIDFPTKETSCHFDIGILGEDRNRNFWFNTNGYGICRYNTTTKVFTGYTKEDGLGSNFVQCMLEDKAGNLWFGERAGGVCQFDSATNRFTKINGDGCFSSQIMEIMEDHTGNIWFVNLYNGLCRYDWKSMLTGQASFSHLTVADGLCHDSITCIHEDQKGNLWLGSDSGKRVNVEGGVCRFNPATGESTSYTVKDGILQSNVWTIVEEIDGTIWVGTKGGLYRYHAASGRFVDYTYKVDKKD